MTPEERKEYMKGWFESDKGKLLRKKTILDRAVVSQRIPNKEIISKHNISTQEVQNILQQIKNNI